MILNFTVDWKESLLIFLGLVIIVLLFYVFNKKSIQQERDVRKLLKSRMAQDNYTQPVVNEVVRKSTPQITQAYERLIILVERIDLQKLVVRITPISTLKQDYANFLIQNIEQEYDFNISQQLYVSEEAWALIATAKQTIIQQILKNSLNVEVKDADDLQRKLLQSKEPNSVTDLAKNRLKQEFKNLV